MLKFFFNEENPRIIEVGTKNSIEADVETIKGYHEIWLKTNRTARTIKELESVVEDY